MSSHKVLVPYNFTRYDQKALDFVTHTFVNQKDAEITLFNTYVPTPVIDVRSSPVMEKMMGNVAYLSKKITEHEAAIKAAKDTLVQKGFSENQVHYIFGPRKKDIVRDIIDLCVSGKFDMVVLNRDHDKIGRFFTGSVSGKVVNGLKDVTVCIIT